MVNPQRGNVSNSRIENNNVRQPNGNLQSDRSGRLQQNTDRGGNRTAPTQDGRRMENNGNIRMNNNNNQRVIENANPTQTRPNQGTPRKIQIFNNNRQSAPVQRSTPAPSRNQNTQSQPTRTAPARQNSTPTREYSAPSRSNNSSGSYSPPSSGGRTGGSRR